MKEFFFGITVLIIFVLGLLFVVNFIIDSNQKSVDADCKLKFGNEWSGRYHSYAGSKCVNGNGDVKYL